MTMKCNTYNKTAVSENGIYVPCVLDYSTKKLIPLLFLSNHMTTNEIYNTISLEEFMQCAGSTVFGDKVFHVPKLHDCLGNKIATLVRSHKEMEEKFKQYSHYMEDDGEDEWLVAYILEQSSDKNLYYIKHNYLTEKHYNEAMDIKSINTYAIKDAYVFTHEIFAKMDEYTGYNDEL